MAVFLMLVQRFALFLAIAASFFCCRTHQNQSEVLSQIKPIGYSDEEFIQILLRSGIIREAKSNSEHDEYFWRFPSLRKCLSDNFCHESHRQCKADTPCLVNKEYLLGNFKNRLNQTLSQGDSLRSRYLHEELQKRWGKSYTNKNPDYAWEALVKKSQENRKRISNEWKSFHSSKMIKKIRDDPLKLYWMVKHNTLSPPVGDYLLSARILDIVMGEGLNSFSFNKDYLKSWGNIFAYILPYIEIEKKDCTKIKEKKTENFFDNYGDLEISGFPLKGKFAWVSWYIMYPEDLLNFLNSTQRSTLESLFENLNDRYHFKESLQINNYDNRMILPDWRSVDQLITFKDEPNLQLTIEEFFKESLLKLQDFDLIAEDYVGMYEELFAQYSLYYNIVDASQDQNINCIKSMENGRIHYLAVLEQNFLSQFFPYPRNLNQGSGVLRNSAYYYPEYKYVGFYTLKGR